MIRRCSSTLFVAMFLVLAASFPAAATGDEPLPINGSLILSGAIVATDTTAAAKIPTRCDYVAGYYWSGLRYPDGHVEATILWDASTYCNGDMDQLVVWADLHTPWNTSFRSPVSVCGQPCRSAHSASSYHCLVCNGLWRVHSFHVMEFPIPAIAYGGAGAGVCRPVNVFTVRCEHDIPFFIS